MSEAERARLAEVFRVVFDLPADADPARARREALAAWDSLGHVMLVSAICSEFDVEISPVDSLDLTSFDAAADLLGALLGEESRR